MRLIAVGLSHHQAPLEVRERLAIPQTGLEAAIDRLGEHVGEGVILSTCNRVEIYANVEGRASGMSKLAQFLSAESGLLQDELSAHLTSYWQGAAARHLFKVAAGLDSMILGEGQVLGQVSDAYRRAAIRGRVGPLLSRLFESALKVGKRARAETAIARNAVSVSQAAVELARRVVGDLDSATLVVVGAGTMGELAARAVLKRGGRVILVNRTTQRAAALVRGLGGEAWGLDRLPESLLEADVLIATTSAERFLLSSDTLEQAMRARLGQPLVVVDIAVPRNVDPRAAEVPGVHLFNVDDLKHVCALNLDQRRREAARVEAIVDEEFDKFDRWRRSREVAPTIGALVKRAESIRQLELARTLGRLGPLSDRDVSAIEAMTEAIVNKLLHTPIVRLKDRSAEHNSEHYLHAVRELFDLSTVEATAE